MSRDMKRVSNDKSIDEISGKGEGGNLTSQGIGLCHSNCKSTTYTSRKTSEKYTHKFGTVEKVHQ